MGGFRPGAGRPKKVDPAVVSAEKALNSGKKGKRFRTALDFAMAVINGDVAADMEAKIRLAIAVLPFQHPKLAEQAATKKEQKVEAAKRIASSGMFAVPEPPRLIVDNA